MTTNTIKRAAGPRSGPGVRYRIITATAERVRVRRTSREVRP
jgi:hypothetical protein